MKTIRENREDDGFRLLIERKHGIWEIELQSARVIKTRFLENHGSEADYTAGLLYAEDNGWLEVTPRDLGITGTTVDLSRDLHPPDTLTLTAVGFAEI